MEQFMSFYERRFVSTTALAPSIALQMLRKMSDLSGMPRFPSSALLVRLFAHKSPLQASGTIHALEMFRKPKHAEALLQGLAEFEILELLWAKYIRSCIALARMCWLYNDACSNRVRQPKIVRTWVSSVNVHKSNSQTYPEVKTSLWKEIGTEECSCPPSSIIHNCKMNTTPISVSGFEVSLIWK